MQIKIGDFGMSFEVPEEWDHALRNSFCGTYQFIAPEIYKSDKDGSMYRYSFKNDVWAIGVIAYTLLTGANPFTVQAESVQHLQELIRECKWSLPKDLPDARHSVHARNFVTLLLQEDPELRPSISEVKAHPFLAGDKCFIPESLPESVFKRPLTHLEKILITEK